MSDRYCKDCGTRLHPDYYPWLKETVCTHCSIIRQMNAERRERLEHLRPKTDEVPPALRPESV